jgi:histidinol dehydrogenase
MIPIIKYKGPGQHPGLLQRPVSDLARMTTQVDAIMQRVRQDGDLAVMEYTQQFDQVVLSSLSVNDLEWNQAELLLDETLKAGINLAIKNIKTFHQAQKEKDLVVETMPGVVCSRKSIPVQKVGLYIPGGTAPLFSTLMMLGIPAVIAGCREIAVCTPAQKDGTIHPAVLYVAQRIGIRKVFKAGGVQAIAAMAYGTDTIPKVDKLFGPGNQYVTCAKMRAQQEGIAIDLPAGPSEVAILADAYSVPAFIAADLLSQAEHGADSQVLLVSDNALVLEAVRQNLAEQLAALPRKETAAAALANSKAILVSSLEQGMELMNEYAPEHLILACRNAEELATKVTNAGSVFIGNYSPESVGDYASGTNHTLPTNGYARAYSGVSLDSFVKKITFQQLSITGLQQIGPAVIALAQAEGLEAHARAVSIRLDAMG